MSSSQPVVLFSTLAVQAALEKALPGFTEQTGIALDATFEPTTVLQRMIDEGARPEVIVGVTGAVTSLVPAGVVAASSITAIARSRIGIAVAPGTPHPAIGTVEELTASLLAARSVAYSRTGASGIYFVSMLEKLGIAEEVTAKGTMIEKGFTAFALVDGRADLAIQQLSELRFVPEADVVGPLPEEVQQYTDFSVALGTGVERQEAVALIEFLSSAETLRGYGESGLEPPRLQ